MLIIVMKVKYYILANAYTVAHSKYLINDEGDDNHDDEGPI